MRIISFTLCVVLVTALFSCRKDERCGDNVLVGEVKLLQNSRDMMAYQSNSALTFVNGQGDELVFEVFQELEEQEEEVSTEQICFGAGAFGRSTFEYYLVNSLNIGFKTNDNAYRFNIRLFVANLPDYNQPLDAFYDRFVLNMSGQNQSLGSIRLITADRNQSLSLQPMPDDLVSYHFVADTLLGGRTYTQVYWAQISGTNRAVFYTAAQGVIAFKTADGLASEWYLFSE
jgi:hypothetical protein